MSTSGDDQSGVVYKILVRDAWDDACRSGLYHGSTDDLRDGFVHLSNPRQLSGTLEKYFLGQSQLLLIAFQSKDLGEKLRWEASRGGQLFPHYYGSLPTILARKVQAIELDGAGVPILPGDID